MRNGIDPAALRALVETLRLNCQFPEKRCTDTKLVKPSLCFVCKAAAALTALLDEREKLLDWRADVTVALLRPGGSHFEDVPKHIKGLRTALRDLLDAIPDETAAADPPLRAWMDLAEKALGWLAEADQEGR